MFLIKLLLHRRLKFKGDSFIYQSVVPYRKDMFCNLNTVLGKEVLQNKHLVIK